MENGVIFILSVKFVSFVSPSPVNKYIVRPLRDEWNQNPHSITQLHVFLLDAAFISSKHQTRFSIDIWFCSRRLNFVFVFL